MKEEEGEPCLRHLRGMIVAASFPT